MKIKYYETPAGRSPVEEFFLALPEVTRLEIAAALILLESGHRLEMPLSKNLQQKTEGDIIMAWKEISVEELAKSLGANVAEIREKQRLVALIVKTRKEKKLSQASIAKKLGISQARIAQIESSVGTAKVTFDILFNLLIVLGWDYRVVTKKAA